MMNDDGDDDDSNNNNDNDNNINKMSFDEYTCLFFCMLLAITLRR